jgi:hypothetical protein
MTQQAFGLIGYGHTKDVQEGRMIWNKEKAEVYVMA